ncbi:MAG TPA: hypothetical protein VFD41_06105 [Actinomycetales bacterium]|nr:hypothetical protein [Actinomycetales bacterium]
MADLRLAFRGWVRSGTYAAVPAGTLTDGRLTGRVELTLREQEAGEVAVEPVEFDLLGPGDAVSLRPGAVTRTMPAPGTLDFETTKSAYVELRAADLPWRYTPERASGELLRPWLVLVTARPGAGEASLQSGGTVTLTGSALAAHDLSRSARWAHVQEDADSPGPQLARLLSPRPLEAQTEYLAVLVPAFTPDGLPSWTVGTPSVTLPAHHWWTFRTAEEGDFPTLASRLHAGPADPTLGRAALGYPPVPAAEELSVRGALCPIGATDAPVDDPVADDVEQLTTPLTDPRRPVVGMPAYGDAWVADPSDTTWGVTFRRDPRHRAVGGLGLAMGIDEQDQLADAAAAQAGALAAAAQRIRFLVTGLSAARGLWGRRLPADPVHRLAVLGPALGRLMTPAGVVLDRATADDRPLPPSLFSTAARRVLRPGPNRVAGAAPGAANPAAVLEAANRCPPLPDRGPKGSLHADDLAGRAGIEPLDDLLRAGGADPEERAKRLKELVERFDRSPYSDSTVEHFDQVMAQWVERAAQGQPLPLEQLLAILDPPGKPPDEEQLQLMLRGLRGEVREQPLTDAGKGLVTRPPRRPCRPVDLDRFAVDVAAAFDPTADRPFVVDRVLSLITGLDDQPLTPPELCPDLDIPAWQMLRDHAKDWLLPGAQQMDDDSVVAVETNPAFVDAFLLGLNTQTLGELRFRNIPVVAGCTPLRQFWARADTATGTYLDDIVGVHAWPVGSGLGTTAHQTPAASSADLVVVFRTPLFRRYPTTVVYLTAAPLVGGEPDWDGDPDLSARLLPAFQGSVTPDIVFFGFDLDPALGAGHWVVLEEPPQGFQFFNATTGPDGEPIPGVDAGPFHGATDGGAFADAAFADPYRVMIRGDALIAGG